MSHYAVMVILDETVSRDAIEEAMKPHSEDVGSEGHWDWYVIGGRWDGDMTNAGPPPGCRCEPPEDGMVRMTTEGIDCHYSDLHRSLSRNCAPLADVAEYRPYAYVLPDGRWMQGDQWAGYAKLAEADEDGYVGIDWSVPADPEAACAEQKRFRAEMAELLPAFRNCWAVLVDCHS